MLAPCRYFTVDLGVLASVKLYSVYLCKLSLLNYEIIANTIDIPFLLGFLFTI